MKTYIQLEPDRSKGHWKFQHDPDTQPPLSELYTPEIVALMVDVSDYEQEPGETWEFDGEKFIAPAVPEPVTPTPQELLAQLTKIQTEYNNLHYSDLIQKAFSNLNGDPRVSAESKAKILAAWDWGQSIGVYCMGISQAILAGERTTLDDVNLAAVFDESDPQVLLTVTNGKLDVMLASEMQ